MTLNRRKLMMGVAATAAVLPWAARAEQGQIRSNIASFRVHDWQDHFDSLGRGVMISDTTTKVLQYWSADGQMRVFPTSAPLSEDLTRRGYTEVVEKRANPGWAPTPSMRASNPDWPAYVKGGDPANPMGTRALYLSWPYYRIHGTHDTRKIGRRASSGCIGLYNEHIEELFDQVVLGTQVKLI